MARPYPHMFDDLAAIAADTGRDVSERRLAKVALEQVDETRARLLAREFVQHSDRIIQEPLDLLSITLATLVRSAAPEDGALMRAASAALPGAMGPEADTDDLQALQDMFAEAQALVAAADAD